MAALIRKLVTVAPAGTLTFIIVLVGGLSSVATDAGYLILIPLGAAAFLSVGRHPLAGLAAAYAGVSAGFAVNVLHHAARRPAHRGHQRGHRAGDPDRSIDLTANLWFSIASTLFVALVITFIAERIIEPAPRRPTHRADAADGAGDATEDPAADRRRDAARPRPGACASPAGGCWPSVRRGRAAHRAARTPRCGTRRPASIFDDSPLMESLIFIITCSSWWPASAYGIGRQDASRSSVDVINAITKTFAGPGQPGVPAAADQPVHRLLQLLATCPRWRR